MVDREKVIKGLEHCSEDGCKDCPYELDCTMYDGFSVLAKDALARLKEMDSLIGIQQTVDSITFISTGTAQQGEKRGILLGKSLMHEWIYNELLYKGLLTDDIRSVFEQAKRI